MSEIRANTVSNAAGTGPATLTGQYAAKAWVNFNGTGTVAIRESGNVSSITDNGTADYTANFTNAFVDANFVMSGNAGNFTGGTATPRVVGRNGTWTTTEARVLNESTTSTEVDDDYIGLIFVR